MTPRCLLCGNDLHGMCVDAGICVMHTEGSAEGAKSACDFFHRGIEPKPGDASQPPVEWLEV